MHQRLAAWQEDRGDLDGAVATLKGLRAAKGFYVPHAMFDIARVEMARGNTEEAKKPIWKRTRAGARGLLFKRTGEGPTR